MLLFLPVIQINGQSDNANGTPNVYIAGSFTNGIEETACYWKNEQMVSLKEKGCTDAIAVENGFVYTAGSGYGKVRSNDLVARDYLWYYSKGERVVKGTQYSLSIKSMAVSNGNVYITGEYFTQDKWVTWVNGTEVLGGGNAIVAHGGEIYTIIAARRGTNADALSAYGQRVNLGGKALGLDVPYGITYVCGDFYNKQSWSPCYWLDGVKKILPKPVGCTDAWLEDIAVLSNGNVYAIGSKKATNGEFLPIYWLNNRWAEIPGAKSYTAICAFEDKIYVLGRTQRGAFSVPCYWVIREDMQVGFKIEKVVVIPGARSVTDIVVTR